MRRTPALPMRDPARRFAGRCGAAPRSFIAFSSSIGADGSRRNAAVHRHRSHLKHHRCRAYSADCDHITKGVPRREEIMEQICREPPLAQLLADPVIQALMASDGVDRNEIDEIIEMARRRIERAARVDEGDRRRR
jgi:hypothetical protein